MLWVELLELIATVEELPAPVVFAAHALTLTAAFELSLACDLIVDEPEGELWPGRESGRADPLDGRHPASGRAGWQRARPPVRDERRDLRAEELERWGVVNAIYEDAGFEPRCAGHSPRTWPPARPRPTR